MKNSAWRLYLVAVHTALVIAIAAFVWARSTDRGMPASLDWVGGAGDLTADQRALLESVDKDWEKTKHVFVRANGDAVAMLTFENNTLQMIDAAWPGDDTVWTLKENGSLLTRPWGIEPDAYAAAEVLGSDLSGDRMIDLERHTLDRGTRVYRRVRQHRYDLRVGDLGIDHALYDRFGVVAARVTDDPNQPAVAVEHVENGTVVITESIERDAFDIDALSDELWHRE